MLHNTWVEVEYRLEIYRTTNGSHVEVYGILAVPVTSLALKSYLKLFIRAGSMIHVTGNNAFFAMKNCTEYQYIGLNYAKLI